MLASAGENSDERHVGHNPTSVFWGLVHVYLLNTYFVPAAILGNEQDRQNRQSLCSCGIYMLVESTGPNQENEQMNKVS